MIAYRFQLVTAYRNGERTIRMFDTHENVTAAAMRHIYGDREVDFDPPYRTPQIARMEIHDLYPFGVGCLAFYGDDNG